MKYILLSTSFVPPQVYASENGARYQQTHALAGILPEIIEMKLLESGDLLLTDGYQFQEIFPNPQIGQTVQTDSVTSSLRMVSVGRVVTGSHYILKITKITPHFHGIPLWPMAKTKEVKLGQLGNCKMQLEITVTNLTGRVIGNHNALYQAQVTS